ncbi:hypothetical protein BJ170DRAFT_681310 [Xylariales sp. AK1849]|nr:hypothetical protein BJ170DRAFT_681310 [Xylariales sp. AK1849]
MDSSAKPRRTQFSSCDTCRQARVACDASKTGYRPGETRWAGSCTRCFVRNRRCTFEWIRDMKKSSLQLHRNSKSQIPLATPASFILWEPPDEAGTLSAEAVDNLLMRWSIPIFEQGFATLFGQWAGKNGCPLVNEPSSGISIPPMKLFCDLDALMAEQLSGDTPSHASETARRRLDRDNQINQSLRLAMQSYAARWLPAVTQSIPIKKCQFEEVVREYWCAVRRDMLKVINRVSYRSVLTLYLFSQTPIPVGVSEDEELDGITGVVCIQTALLQIQQLRGRLRSCQYDGSEMPAWSGASVSSAPSPTLTPMFVDLESRAYWAAVTWDTSSSVTLNVRSTLSTGLRGACLEPAWVLARGFLVESFHSTTKEWRKEGFVVSDEVAPQIISAAGICGLYLWRTLASVKEALREGVDEDSVLFAWRSLLDGLDVFKTTIRPLLDNCERRYHFLSQTNRLYWYEISLHYYLGVLILVDAVEAAHRSDLLSQLTEAKLDAEHKSLDVLQMGLESTYIIYGPPEESESASNVDCRTYTPGRSTATTSFVAIDPFPHHVIASVRLVNKAIKRRYRQGNIKHEAYAHLLATLLQALEQLPQSSKSVCSTREDLRRSIRELSATRAADATVGNDKK